jgi:beta-barrel assembly-enhancing protease
MKQLKIPVLIAAFSTVILGNSCSEGGGVNIFSIEDDIALGAQLAAQIEADPATYPILDSAAYPEAYGFIYDIRDRILASNKLYNKNTFGWEIKIINDDNVVNAFCTPGGYIYVYTGLIRYLEDESQLAGVLGHEMAHADLRHSTDQLTEAYGLSLLLSIVLGEDESVLADVASSLTQLAFSRGDESQADEYSVIYLCPTDYVASGAAGFFEKIEEEGGVEIPEFLSTHPSPDSRIEDIHAKADELACSGSDIYVGRYNDLIDALP